MENEVKEYFDVLHALIRQEELSLKSAYRQLRELLELLCRREIGDESLQMTDLSARISLVAAKQGLSVSEQNRLHTLRITSNTVLNNKGDYSRKELLRDVKTLAFFIKRSTGEEVPDELYRLLPRTDSTYLLTPTYGERVKQLRVCFQYSDERYLYVRPSDTVSEELWKVRYNVPQINEEFQETCKVLWKHAQLNLLDVTIDAEGILTPFFIILEPDYLIDISALAECFKDYGHHPLNYILARFQMQDNTRPLLLGNIANLFLDEWIHAENEPDYVTCMKKAFRIYPLELAACPDLQDRQKEREFFADCKTHFEHIRQTVNETFLQPGYELDKKDAVLEPSYICEALGLQGRLDYMQRDRSSFIEMKSGKADEYSIRGKVEPKENNMVQMLLYQAVLEYSRGMDHRKVKAYLLYTRYPLLYPARPSWAMVRRVMDVRNRIVANEYAVQLRNSVDYTEGLLKEITPEVLNEKPLQNVLWTRYLRPSIDLFAQGLEALSSLERSYFYSLYNFITRELYTSKTGDVDREGRVGAASLWFATLDEKIQAGEILYDLQVEENHASDPHKAYVSLRLPPSREEEILPNFREGDAVVLYQRDSSADNVSNKMVFKGNIEQLTKDVIRIRLRASQHNTAVLPSESSYAVEHDYMDTGFRGMYGGLSAFLVANKERRDLLLGQRMPQFDHSFDARISSTSEGFERVALKACAAKDYFLLVGPPGTGKTSRALRRMVESFYQEKKQILLLSYTNRAVDEICKALSAITPEIDFIRIGSELSCAPAYRKHLIENVLETCSTRREVQQRIEGCSVFVGTVSTLSSKTDIFRLKTFDVAIIDEASQILEPQLLSLLCYRTRSGENAIGKFIMIGDHKQLPAVVLQSPVHTEVTDEALRAVGFCNLKDSFFERLYSMTITACSSTEVTRVYDMLCQQGRMHPAIAAFPNEVFYGGKLESVGLPHQLSVELPVLCYTNKDISTQEFSQRVCFIPSVAESFVSSPKVNHTEAEIVAQLAKAVYKLYFETGDMTKSELSCDSTVTLHAENIHPSTVSLASIASVLGIITPYRSQIALIRKEIAKLGIAALNEVLVDTVERFQGSERDVIIYSFCLNRSYQLRYLCNTTEEEGVKIDRKLNVALTRARKQLFVTGVPELLRQDPIYDQLLNHILGMGTDFSKS